MIKVSQNILSQLSEVLSNLTTENYTMPLEIFSGASIGQHTRHILEFYMCLISNSEADVINYDLRKRDTNLEQNLEFCISTIDQIKCDLDNLTSERELSLEAMQGGTNVSVKTTFNREVLYAVEHTVHHMAIIKMGVLLNYPKIKIPENFGVAESTIRYKNTCAQ